MTKGNSTDRTPEQVVQDYFAAFGSGDIDAALDFIAENAVWHIDGDTAVGTVGLLRGRTQIHSWLTRFPSLFQPMAFSVEPLICKDQDVIAFGRFRHRVLATDAIADGDFTIRFTVHQGQIARYQIFEDSAALSDAFRSDSARRTGLINRTHYGWSDHGAGPAVIFLHGLFLDRSLFDAQIAALSGDYRCVAFDMAGHGASGWRDGLTLDGMADDLALWIAEQRLDQVTVVGHSMGAMVAMRLAARYPDLVSGLVLINTRARAEAADRRPLWEALRAQIANGDDAARSAAFAQIQQNTRPAGWMQDHGTAAASERAIMTSHHPLQLVNALDVAVLNRQDFTDLLAKISAKTFVLAGECDTAMPPSFAAEIAAGIVGADLRIVAQAAHRLPDEAPDIVTATVRQILRDAHTASESVIG